MAEVFLGHPVNGAAILVIKALTLARGAPDYDLDLAQFRREHEILVSLSHPALPRPLDFFQEGDTWFLVEEYVHGETVEAILEREGKLAHNQALEIVVALLDVLEVLHARGIVYRDVKPSNLIRDAAGQIHLLDFGAARKWKRGATRDTVALGTPGFASPEHYGGQTDARSDIYSVGVSLHHLLTGKDPHGFNLEPLQLHCPDVPSWVEDAIVQATEMAPQRRFLSTQEMKYTLVAGDQSGRSSLGRLIKTIEPTRLDDWGLSGPPSPSRFLVCCVMALFFGYFDIGLFVLVAIVAAVISCLEYISEQAIYQRYIELLGTRLEVHEYGFTLLHRPSTPSLCALYSEVDCVHAELDRYSRPLRMHLSVSGQIHDMPESWPGLQPFLHALRADAGLRDQSLFRFIGQVKLVRQPCG